MLDSTMASLRYAANQEIPRTCLLRYAFWLYSLPAFFVLLLDLILSASSEPYRWWDVLRNALIFLGFFSSATLPARLVVHHLYKHPAKHVIWMALGIWQIWACSLAFLTYIGAWLFDVLLYRYIVFPEMGLTGFGPRTLDHLPGVYPSLELVDLVRVTFVIIVLLLPFSIIPTILVANKYKRSQE